MSLPHPLLLLAEAQPSESLMELIIGGELMVQLVLLVLVLFSVGSWAIILTKLRLQGAARKENDAFLKIFWESDRLEDAFAEVDAHPNGPVAQTFKAGYRELRRLTGEDIPAKRLPPEAMDNLTRAMRRARAAQLKTLENHLPFLATCGSASPFIGLFGTVWGIMRAFQKIGLTGAATLSTVGGPISEALIATAVGLLAAIPAVMAYNFFVSRNRGVMTDTDNFIADFLNLIQRHFVRD